MRAELPSFVNPATHKITVRFDPSGFDATCWAFVLLRHLAFPKGIGQKEESPAFPQTAAELEAAASAHECRNPRLGTLACYSSSPDAQLYFCSQCSASVMYRCGEQIDLVGLAIGLLDAPDGAGAEGILTWSLGSPTQ